MVKCRPSGLPKGLWLASRAEGYSAWVRFRRPPGLAVAHLHIQSLSVIKSYCYHFKNEETEATKRSTNCSEDTPPGRGRIRTWIQTRSCQTTRRTEFGARCLQTKSGDQKSSASTSAGCKRGISPRGSRDLVTNPHIFVPPPCSTGDLSNSSISFQTPKLEMATI